jgi:hypothetical protein
MPQPIDLQTELMRVTAAERVQQAVDRVSLAAQGRASAHLQQDGLVKETLVQQTTQAEQSRVEEEGRGDPNRRKRRRSPSNAPAADPASRTFYAVDEKPHVVDDPGEHHLDVTV